MKASILISLSLISQLLLYSCSHPVGEQAQRSFSLSKSEVALDHGNLLLNNRSFFKKIVGLDSMLLFDGNSLQFVLYDLKSKKQILTISTPREGPDFFDFPFMDVEIEGNTLYVLSKSFFSTYNISGKNLVRFGTNEIHSSKSNYMTFNFRLVRNDSVLFNRVPNQAVYGRKTSTLVDSTIYFSFNINSGSHSKINVVSPPETLLSDDSRGYFQDFSFHSFIIQNDSIIYNYPFTSKTFIYDNANNKHSTKQNNSALVTNMRKTAKPEIIPTSDWVKYLYTGPKYSSMTRDEKTNNFVRVGAEFQLQPDGSMFNSKYLMIFDNNLNMIEEFELDVRIMEPPLVTNGKIYLMKTDQSKENAYEFLVYEMKSNKELR
ncbi:hypothetical protein [Roseivirga sp.]|uniref:hypothetical protein n=1 Tax=Roseivirga sp. TaxID=1964215 RepID=UPI003B8C7348